MALNGSSTGTASVGKLANELDKADPAEAGKYLQSLTGNVSGLVTTVINGLGEYKADPSLPAFDPAFTRESYGKAAVSDSVVTDADKKGYLLDDRQTAIGRALAVISALEYQNGLRVVRDDITDSEFTNQLSEPDLNDFDAYPEEIFVNASELNSTSKQQFIFDAIVVSEDAMDGLGDSELALQSVTTLDIAEGEIDSTDMARGKYLMARAGGDHTAVDAFTDVVSNESQITTIAQSEDALADLDALPNAIDDVVASSTAMNVMSTTQTAVDFIGISSNLFTDISNNRSAIAKYVVARANLDPSVYGSLNDVVSDTDTMADIAASQAALDTAIAASSPAISSMVESETAMNEFSVSTLALDTLESDNYAYDLIKSDSMAIGKFVVGRAGLDGSNYADMDAVATSETAMNAVSASSTAMNTIRDSTLAWNDVNSRDMALAKFIVGRAGLDGSNYNSIGAVVSDGTAMNEVVADFDARDLLTSIELADDQARSSDTAMGKLTAEEAGLTPDNYTDHTELVNDSTAFDTVLGNEAARTTALTYTGVTSNIFASSTLSEALWNRADLYSGNYKDTFDLTGISTLEIHAEDESIADVYYALDGEYGDDSVQGVETVDVSGYSGSTEIKFDGNDVFDGFVPNGYGGSAPEWYQDSYSDRKARVNYFRLIR